MNKVRSYASEFTMRFGPATTRGRLLPIRMADKTPKIHLCTPDGQPVRQCYVDDAGKIFYKEDLGRAVLDDDGNLIQVNAEAVEEAKQSSLPLNTLNLTAHSLDDVDQYLFPSNNNAYIFEPVIKNGKKIVDDPANVQWHDFLNTLVRDSGFGFVGLCNLRNFEGLFRLSHYQGYIVVQKQLYPENLNQFEHIHPNLPKADKAKALSVVRAMVAPFDPLAYENALIQRLADATEVDYDPTSITVSSPASDTPAFSISDALDAFLQ